MILWDGWNKTSWRGTRKGKKLVELRKRSRGSYPADLLVIVTPNKVTLSCNRAFHFSDQDFFDLYTVVQEARQVF